MPNSTRRRRFSPAWLECSLKRKTFQCVEIHILTTLFVRGTEGDRREFQVGSFGGITGGKSGVKRDKELSYKAEHVGIRTYKLTLDAEFKPGEYGFFMGTSQASTMSGARGGNRSGGAASGRIYDFSIPE